MDLEGIIEALILIFPAMVANGAPVVAARFYKRGHPIDMGKTLGGRRILGDGKTVEGFLAGLVAGLATGVLESILLDRSLVEPALVASLGALLGDMAGSFLKRRLGLPRGAPAPLLDQLDFYIGALAMLEAAGYRIGVGPAIVMGGVILVLHVATNRIAYMLRLKNVPW